MTWLYKCLLINPSGAPNKKQGKHRFYFYERLGYPLPPFSRLKLRVVRTGFEPIQ